MNLIIPVIFFFLNTSPMPEGNSYMIPEYPLRTIFIVKQRWHTGIVLRQKDVDTLIWKEINDFKNFNWVDVGWGDKEFYQYPDFDLGLAIQALFYPTESALRIEGFNFSITKYIEISDLVFEINLDNKSFDKLCAFISKKYERTPEKSTIIISEKYGGNIKFYEAEGDYHLFNTCNSWVAEALNYAGMNISTNLILAEQLFNALKMDE